MVPREIRSRSRNESDSAFIRSSVRREVQLGLRGNGYWHGSEREAEEIQWTPQWSAMLDVVKSEMVARRTAASKRQNASMGQDREYSEAAGADRSTFFAMEEFHADLGSSGIGQGRGDERASQRSRETSIPIHLEFDGDEEDRKKSRNEKSSLSFSNKDRQTLQ